MPSNETPATLLVVDDDEQIRTLLTRNISARGYKVLTASSTSEMDHLLTTEEVDVVILDIMMPGEDGLSACRRLAAEGGPPVIVLSALGEEHDRIVGLEVGADHYLSKPCSAHEILAHVRAVLRRQQWHEPKSRRAVSFSGFRVVLDAHEVYDQDGVLVHLSDGEFAVLRAFIERPRRILSRDELLLAARGRHSEAFDRAIDVQVSRLRRKLSGSEQDLIRTIRNEGYMFVAEVVPEQRSRYPQAKPGP